MKTLIRPSALISTKAIKIFKKTGNICFGFKLFIRFISADGPQIWEKMYSHELCDYLYTTQ